MQKYVVEIISAVIIAALLVWGILAYNNSLREEGKQQITTEQTKESLKISEEAKKQGEQATIRADKAKSEVNKQAEEVKEKLRESFTSSDDEPLSYDDIIQLCRAYSYTDCVQESAG